MPEDADEYICIWAKQVKDRCMELVCVYAALTLFRHRDIKARNKIGEDLRNNLKQSLATQQSLNPAQPVFASDVDAMREFLRSNPDEPPAKKARAESD